MPTPQYGLNRKALAAGSSGNAGSSRLANWGNPRLAPGGSKTGSGPLLICGASSLQPGKKRLAARFLAWNPVHCPRVQLAMFTLLSKLTLYG